MVTINITVLRPTVDIANIHQSGLVGRGFSHPKGLCICYRDCNGLAMSTLL